MRRAARGLLRRRRAHRRSARPGRRASSGARARTTWASRRCASCCAGTRRSRPSGSATSSSPRPRRSATRDSRSAATSRSSPAFPQTVPGFAVDRMCAGALTAVTAAAGEIALGAADVALAGGIEHMGHHPMGEDVDFNPRFVSERLIDESAAVMGQTAENLHDRFPRSRASARTRSRSRRSSAPPRRGRTASCSETVVPMAVFTDDGWKVAERDEFLRPDTSARRARRAEAGVPRGRPRHGGQLGGSDRRRDGRVPRGRGHGRRARPRRRSCASSATRTRASSRT